MTNKFGALCLIAGTAVGSGMLALPLCTYHLGFWYSTCLLFFIWLSMYFSALMMLEASLRAGRGHNLVSITGSNLGYGGQIIAWTIYLSLLYALTAAYLAGLVDIFGFFLKGLALQIHENVLLVCLSCLFACILLFGIASIDRINRLLVLVVIGLFSLLTFYLLSEVRLDYLSESDGFSLNSFISPALLVVTSFGYHIVIPSLRDLLSSNTKELVKSIYQGSLLTLFIYLLWQFIVLGSLPLGLLSILSRNPDASAIAAAFSDSLNLTYMNSLIQSFQILLIITSFLGVSLSLFDFLADGLCLKKSGRSKYGLVLLVLAPSICLVMFFKHGFFTFLEYGGILVALLLMILPAVLACIGRFKEHFARKQSAYIAPGGYYSIVFVICVALLIILSKFIVL